MATCGGGHVVAASPYSTAGARRTGCQRLSLYGNLQCGNVKKLELGGFWGSQSLKLVTSPICWRSLYPSSRLHVRANAHVRANSDFYGTLGVSKDATKSEIKAAYRKLARQYHPDVSKEPGAEAKFKDVSSSYEVLSDDEKRSIYDKYGVAGLKGGGGFEYASSADLFETLFESMASMDDIGNLGFGSSRTSRPVKGADEEYELQVEFLDAVFGTMRVVEVSMLEACKTCNGSGTKPGTSPKKCKKCGGKGQISSSTRTPLGEFRQVFPCNSCRGAGQSSTPCSTCRGDGCVRKKKSVSIKVPAGIESGNRLRVRSEGHAGKRGGPPGDLYVSVHVRSHPQLRRDGKNILTTCKISYIDAIRGTSVNVMTVDGEAELAIPAGTQPGTMLTMWKKGVPHLGKPRVRGDQLVRVQVAIPKNVSGEERDLIEELAKLREAQPVNA